MTGGHEIVVTPDEGGWRIAIVPPLPLGYESEAFPRSELAMARARLWRLRHGFPIIAPTEMSGRRVR